MVDEKVRWGYPELQIVSLMREAKIGDDHEAIYVGGIILHHIRNSKDIIPKITEHQGLAFASRSLVSLGFFREYISNPKFYLEVGIAEFAAEGKYAVASHMEGWTDYLHDRFKVKIKKQRGIKIPVFYETSRYHKSFPDNGICKRPGFLSGN